MKGKMVSVSSSHIAAVGHDGDTIHVEYKGGALYTGTCSAEDHAKIMASDSVGKALNASGIKLTRIKEVPK